MARVFLLIDGDNLLHAAGYGRARFARGQLQSLRRRMLLELHGRLEPAALPDAVIVFDGVAMELDSAEPARVVFSGLDSDADTIIEQQLLSHSSPRQVLVVSSDHRLHKAASRRGARCIDSEEFWKQLEPRPATSDSMTQASQPEHRVSQHGELHPDDRKLLDSVDLDDLRRSVQAEQRKNR